MQCELFICTSLLSIHALVAPELLLNCAVVSASAPDFTSHVRSPQSRFIMDTEEAHSSASRSTMDPVYPLVQSPMQ
jgi:hypothetical protein